MSEFVTGMDCYLADHEGPDGDLPDHWHCVPWRRCGRLHLTKAEADACTHPADPADDIDLIIGNFRLAGTEDKFGAIRALLTRMTTAERREVLVDLNAGLRGVVEGEGLKVL
jgi:hypothetical protein